MLIHVFSANLVGTRRSVDGAPSQTPRYILTRRHQVPPLGHDPDVRTKVLFDIICEKTHKVW